MLSMKNTAEGREIWVTEAEIEAATHYLKVDVMVKRLINGCQAWQTFRSKNSQTAIHIDHRCDHYEPLMKVN